VKKILKIIGIVVAVLVLAVVGAIAYLVASFDAPRIKQELAAAVAEKTGRTLTIDGDLSLGFWPSLAVRVGHASLSERDGQQEFAKLDAARVSVAVLPLLSKQVAVEEVAVDGFKLTVVKRKDGTLNIADLAGGQPAAQEKVGAGGTAPPDIDVAAIRIHQAALVWRDEQAGKEATLSGLDFTTGPVRMAEGRISAESLKLGATLAEDGKRIAAALSVMNVSGGTGAFKIEKFSLDADAQLKDARIVVALASPVALDLDKRTVALPQLSGKLDLSHPDLPMKTLALPLSGEARADLAKQDAQVKLATQFDETHLKAAVDIGRFSPLALAFDLDIDKLDLDKYLPPKKEQKDESGKIDLSVLKGLDIKGTVRIGQLTAAKLKASNLQLKLQARDGKLDIAPLSANLYEGRLDGTLSADATGNRITVKQNLQGVNIEPLLKDLADRDMLAGRGSVVLDVGGHGDNVDALKKTLAGTARIALSDGAIKGIDIGRKLREAKALLSAKQDATQTGDPTQKTDFSELSASFRIAGGVAHNDDLTAKSPLLRLAGAGDIDIGNERLDYLLKTSVVATSTGQGGKELEHVKGLTVPVRLTGPFDNPAWKLEFAGLATAAVEQKTEEIKGKAEEKLKGKLKGLFGK
jgi:AsmA protein